MWGEFTLPPIQFSYFDPQTGTYHTIETEPINVYVEDNGQLSAPVAIDEQHPRGTANEQLHPIKAAPETGQVPSLITDKFGYWLLWLVPLGLIIAQIGWQRRKNYMLRNPAAQRSHKAAKKAYQALNNLNPNTQDYYYAAGHILLTYLAEKINRTVSGLTRAELSGLLLAHGASEELVDKVRTCLTISDIGQYAPIQQINSDELHHEIKTLISDLDKVL